MKPRCIRRDGGLTPGPCERKLIYMNQSAAETINDRVRVLVVSDTAEPDSGQWDAVWKVAAALAREHDVILALPAATSYSHTDFAVIYYNQRNLGLVAKDSEAVVCGGDIIADHSFFTDDGSIVPTSVTLLRQGFLRERAGEPARAEDPAAGGYYIWFPPEEKNKHGVSHYGKKLRYYLHKGGVRYTAARALKSVKRRLGPGG